MRLSSNLAYQLPIAFQLETAQLQNRLHRPGIEPGPPAWQASILPLNQRCQLTYLPRAIPQLLQKYKDHVSTLTAHMLNFQQVGELPSAVDTVRHSDQDFLPAHKCTAKFSCPLRRDSRILPPKTVALTSAARLAQSVEHETLNLRVVGSSPTLGAQSFSSLPENVVLKCSELGQQVGLRLS